MKVLAVFWSGEIFSEVERNFAAVSGPTNADERCQRLLQAMERFSPGARRDDYPSSLATLPITLHDRHVLACAIVTQASAIVTYNTRHFPEHSLAAYHLRVLHPDELLCALLQQRPGSVIRTLGAQGLALHPPRSHKLF